MIAGTTSMTDGRCPYDPWGNYDSVTTITGGTIWFRCSPTAADTNISIQIRSAESRRNALGHKQWLSWSNVLDRMDEQRHARGRELLRLPDAKAMAPKVRAPSVGRVCSGSSRYRVMSPRG